MSADTLNVTHTLKGHRGNVNALVFSADGTKVAAVSGESGRRGHFGNHDARAGALARHAVELKLIVCAINDPKALVDVAEPDPRAFDPLRGRRRNADAVIDHVDNRMGALAEAPNRNSPFAELVRQRHAEARCVCRGEQLLRAGLPL